MPRALLLLLVTACSSTPCPEYPRPPGPAQAFLWEATGPGTLYLYGTYHIAGRGEVPDVAWGSLASVQALVLELPEERPHTAGFEDLHRLPRGQSLDQLLPADAWFDLRDALAGQVNEDALRRMRPWMAMDLLRRAKFPQREMSMDEAILREAKRRGLEVLALEGWEEQLGIVDETADAKDLALMIEERDQIACNLGRKIAAYRAGDLETMAGSFDELTADKLLGQRNRRWVVRLDEIARGKRAFVAVGVSHMAGPAGLPALLEEKGYRVRRL